jgi:hypothetical protein
VCRSAIALKLLVVMSCVYKWLINPIYPNHTPFNNHTLLKGKGKVVPVLKYLSTTAIRRMGEWMDLGTSWR